MRSLISAGIIIEKKDNSFKLIFPMYFITTAGCIVKKSKRQLSGNGEPRYTINPNAPRSTYCIDSCVKDGWIPVFKYKTPTATYHQYNYVKQNWIDNLFIHKLINKNEKIRS